MKNTFERAVRVCGWVALVVMTAGGLGAGPESPVLASWSASGGLTPFGVSHQECRVRVDGRFEWYEQQRDMRHQPGASDAPTAFDGWFSAQVKAEDLDALRKAIAATPFGELTPDANAQRPSAADGSDVTVTFRAGTAEHTLNLWQIHEARSLPAVAALVKLRDAYAKPPADNPR